MNDVSALAEEKVHLQMKLQAISMQNVYGRKLDDLVALEKDKIETIKRLNEVEAKINEYTGSLAYQNPFNH